MPPQTTEPGIDPSVPLDLEIARKYVAYLSQGKRSDGAQTRLDFCRESSVHPKLLYNNPHLKDIERLYADQSSLERLGHLDLKAYLRYHYYYIHQGYRYGQPRMQQKWMGRDLIKTPMDCWVYQEILHEVKPDVVIELGVMFGGATHFYASILELIGKGEVIGIDISLAKAEAPASKRIRYIEGDSASEAVLSQVRAICAGKTVMVIADSDHEKEHVLRELRAYSPFVTPGSYFIVEDALNDLMGFHPVPNEGPKAAADEFMLTSKDFVVDRRWGERYIMSLNPNGFLRRI